MQKTSELPKLNYIDSLRGVAILMVIIVHTSQSITGLNRYANLLLDYGKTGVQLFFILSAFTLCLSMTKRHDGNLNFYIRRYFRIAPLYYIAIPMYFLLTHFIKWPYRNGVSLYSSFSYFNIICNFLFIHGLVPSANNTIVPGGWSIGAEMLFYLVFPLIFKIYSRVTDIRMYFIIPLFGLLISVVYSITCYKILKINSDVLTRFCFYNILNQLPVFLLGMSLYYLKLNIKNIHSFVLFIVLFPLSFVSSSVFKHDIAIHNFIAGLSFIFLFMLFKNIRQLNVKVLSCIGQLSFSIYIFHFVFAWALSSYLDSTLHINPYLSLAVCIISTLLLSCLIASLSEKYIEGPGIKLGRLLTTKTSTGQKNPTRSV
jgi:peptidoglycan/LPS O-acetylase OafA/YrhL